MRYLAFLIAFVFSIHIALAQQIGGGGTGNVSISVGTAASVAVLDTPTVQNASYTSGQCVGGFRSVTLTSSTSIGGLLQSIGVTSIGGGTESIVVYVFAANPSSSTCTDRGTFTLNAADANNLIGTPISMTLAAPTGTTITAATSGNLAIPFIEGGSSSSGVATIYYAVVAAATFTPATTSDLRVRVGVSMDHT